MIAQLIPIALKASIFGIVLALGLRADMSQGLWLARHPRPLLRAVLTMFVIMPLVAAAVVYVFPLNPAVEVALIALALSPVPPLLPKKELKAGGEENKVIGLLVAAGVLSILIVPIGVSIIAGWFDREVAVSTSRIVALVAWTIVLPLLIGIALRRFLPALADRAADPIGKISTALLILGALPILIMMAPAMWSLVGGGTLAAIIAFVVIGLVVGHFLGGHRGEDQTVLALSTASRHPGIALAIASGAAPDTPLVAPAVLLYLLVGAIVSGIYLAIRRKHAPTGDAATA